MLYMKLPKVKGFHCEVNMDDTYADKTWADDWDAAYLCDGNQKGVTYNFCYDGVGEMSAMYKTEDGDIDETTYKHYEVDFSYDNWKEKLIDAMIDAYHEFFK